MTHDAEGRSMEVADRIDAWRAGALHATLDLDGAPPTEGAPLPHFWHWIYFLEARKARDLGRDGHPAKGGFIPDLGLPRRMWAGGQLEFIAPLPVGADAMRRTFIESVTRKQGRSGPLAFVRLLHEIGAGGAVCVRERQDIVYREDPAPDAPAPQPPRAPDDEDHARRVVFDPTLLFRYSALTFNGHRIHYDRDYATGIEGYPGLVVHGPLIAQLLLSEAETVAGAGAKRFDFRAMSPATDGEPVDLCVKPGDGGADIWARGGDGRLVMQGRVGF